MKKKQSGLATTSVPGTPIRMPQPMARQAADRLPAPSAQVTAAQFGGWRLCPDYAGSQEVPIAESHYVSEVTDLDRKAYRVVFGVTLANGQKFRVTVEDD